jgi:hypothetical protein
MEMLKSEETLHSYIRRHFDNLLRNQARQAAEQTAGFQCDAAAESWDGAPPGNRREGL